MNVNCKHFTNGSFVTLCESRKMVSKEVKNKLLCLTELLTHKISCDIHFLL